MSKSLIVVLALAIAAAYIFRNQNTSEACEPRAVYCLDQDGGVGLISEVYDQAYYMGFMRCVAQVRMPDTEDP